MLNSSIELVEPADLVRAAEGLLESAFVDDYGSAPWLAIRLPPGDEGMAAALRGSGPDCPSVMPPPHLEYHTRVATIAQLKTRAEKRPATKKEPIMGDLAKFLSERSFLIAVHKRLDPEGPLGDRVSIGRAMNKDIVLRHPSISKFHAYFEVMESGEWWVADAGSKNGTTVNGKRLAQRELTEVTNGDRVSFGSIESLFLDARTVWRLLRGM